MKCYETLNINLLWLEQRTVKLFLELYLQLRFICGCQSQSATTFSRFRSTCTRSWNFRVRTWAKLTKGTPKRPLSWNNTFKFFSLYHWPLIGFTDTIFKRWLAHFRLKLTAHNESTHGYMFLSPFEDISEIRSPPSR